MTAPDDLAALFTPALQPPSQDMRFRQGVIVSWNEFTAENTVRVGDTILTNLPILNGSEALTLQPDDVVAIAVIGNEQPGGGARTYAILGRLTVPGTPSAASALDSLARRMRIAIVTDTDSTTSTTFTDLPTFGPEVTGVPVRNGRALVFAAATLNPTTNEASTMGVAVSGATTVAPDSLQLAPQSYLVSWDASQVVVSACRPILVTGLNVGYHTFTAKYKSASGSAVNIGNRAIIVFAL